jgi:hypothetical protein
MYKRNVKARSRNQYCRKKAILRTYYECVTVALVMQHAQRMRHITLSPVSCLAVSHFSTYFINGTIFSNQVIEYKISVSICCTTFPETFPNPRRIQRDI